MTVVGTIKSDLNSSSLSPHLRIHEDDTEFRRITFTNISIPQYFTLAGNLQRDSTLARFKIFNSDFGNIGTFTGHGRFGVNASNPVAALHVNAQADTDLMRMQINNSTKFRIFGNDAMVFGSNWANPCQYKRFNGFPQPGSIPWTVPAGVTEILVELWGGGGGSHNGGGGGSDGYAKAIFEVNVGDILSVVTGNGGLRCFSCCLGW